MNENTSKGSFWGIFLLTFGILLLLDNLNVIQFHWHDIIRLWPVIFIIWGINYLPMKESIKLLIKLIILGLSLYWALSNPTDIMYPDEFDSII